MMSLTTATEYAKGMLDDGRLETVADANIEIVRMMGVRLIRTTLTRDVRSAYSSAVKDGRLGHLPKKGLEPEAFFHPNSKGNALEQRRQAALEKVSVLQTVLGRDKAELEQI